MENNIFESEWSQIDKRLNLQSIGEFIKNGGDTEVDKRSFSERLNDADMTLRKFIRNACGDDKTTDLFEKIIVYSSTVMDVYFSLGMKAGAQIIIQLTGNLEADF